MPPIRAEHGLSWRKGNSHPATTSTGVESDERGKQSRRAVGVPRRHSPSHSRTPSPNQQVVTSASGIQVHVASHGHVFTHGTRRSPSSKTSNTGSTRCAFPDGVNGSREKRRASPDPARKGYAHAHAPRSLGSKSPAFGPPPKGPSVRGSGGSAWGVSSPTQGVVPNSKGISSPTPPNSGRGHTSPTLGREGRGEGNDAQPQPPQPPGHSTLGLSLPPTAAVSSGSAGSSPEGAEAREMTPLDRVFLEQPHEGRKDVEDDDLHLCNEIQRHLQSRVQCQLMEATSRNASAGGGVGNAVVSGSGGRGSGGSGNVISSARSRVINFGSGNGGSSGAGGHLGQAQGVTDSFAEQEMELIEGEGDSYGANSVHDDPESDTASFMGTPSMRRGSQPANGYANSPISMTVGGNELLDDPDLGSAGVPPVSPSSGGGPAQGLVLDVGSSMEFLLDPVDSLGGVRDTRETRGGSGLLSPLDTSLATDVQMGEAGDGQLREVVSGLDAMDLDDVDRALALLTAQKERIIAKQGAAAAAAQAEAQAQAQAAVMVSPQPPPGPTTSANGGSTLSSRTGNGGRHRKSGSRNRHGEVSPSAGGRAEAFGVSGGGVRGAPASFSRVPRGQGRPPPVPGHLLASTAAMRRSSPGNIASLAELDSYLEHHHRRLVEQVEGGVMADDVEAEIRASRHPRRGTRSHQRFGSNSSNGLGSSSSSSSVPRTVGARVSTGSFFHSSLSADGDRHHGEWSAKSGRSNQRGSYSLSGADDRGFDPPPRGPGYKRDRGEQCGGGSDNGVGRRLRDLEGEEAEDRDGGAFMGVSASTQTHSQTSSPPSTMSDDVSVSSYGHPVVVLPTSPNNVTFAGRPPPSLARIRLEAVRSPAVRHSQGRGMEDGPVFTSPDVSKHVQELCSPRSAFTPRSASSLSSLASSPARRR